MYKILGFSKFKSKKGFDCVVLQLAREFSTREAASGSIGVKVEEVFLSEDFVSIAVPENINKTCDIFYNKNGYLSDIKIK